ncbi:hypothetical protein INR49_011369 [Caranx melampygus]|nr:hypothetical protein INR49_011369 [Caranx melampygus]
MDLVVKHLEQGSPVSQAMAHHWVELAMDQVAEQEGFLVEQQEVSLEVAQVLQCTCSVAGGTGGAGGPAGAGQRVGAGGLPTGGIGPGYGGGAGGGYPAKAQKAAKYAAMQALLGAGGYRGAGCQGKYCGRRRK